MTEHIPALLVLVPLLAAVIIPFSPAPLRRAGGLVALLANAAALALAWTLALETFRAGRVTYHFGGWAPPWGIEYAVDPLAAVMLLLIAFVAFAVSVYSRAADSRSAAIAGEEIAQDRLPYYHSAALLLVSGLSGMVITGDVFNLYVFLEISSLAGYAMVAAGRRRDALVAGFNYLILGTIAATFILLGIGYLYMASGTLNIADLRERLPHIYHTRTVLTAFAFLIVGFSIKTALFPLHIWLPDAYTYAPSPASALLAATGTKVGVYAMLRVTYTVFRPEFNASVVPMNAILLVLSSAAVIYGAVMAIAQKDIKRMLAYSSVSQIGYIMLGAAIAGQAALTGSLLHMINHALLKASLFMCAGLLLFSTGAKNISDLNGAARRLPLTMAAFTAAAVSMTGIPPTLGFMSKWHLALGAVEAGIWAVLPVLLAGSLLTGVYFWKIIEPAYLRAGPAAEKEAVRAPFWAEAPAALLAALGLLLGLAVWPAASGQGDGALTGVIYGAARAAAELLGK